MERGGAVPEIVLAPVAAHVDAADPLLLLPYGRLNYLPFDALIDAGREPGGPAALADAGNNKLPHGVLFDMVDQHARAVDERHGKDRRRGGIDIAQRAIDAWQREQSVSAATGNLPL